MGQTTVVGTAALVVDSQTVIPRGALAVSGDEVLACGTAAEVGERFPDAARLDLSELVVLPAFVNAHSHLCFSHLRQSVPCEGSFAAWVIEVGESALFDADDTFPAATRAGAEECRRTGTAAVGDATPRWGIWEALDESGLGGVLFLEIFSFSENTIAQLERELPALAAKHLSIGVSPHAPYTVDAETYRECVAFARANDMRLMTHLAESAEELEFLHDGTGPLAEYFDRRGESEGASWQARGMPPIAYAASLGLLGPRTLIAHGNYLSAAEIGMLADAGAHVVFCPGSHGFFGHPPHPVEDLLSTGVNVALGTDSLASNESLCMRAEAQRLREAHPAIEPAAALRMATENGARALGIEGRYGTLAPGKSASFVGIRVLQRAELTPETVIGAALEAELEVSVIAGQMVEPSREP
jgi:cytosine/adenosine deaminase-related metal-dependent hydrolase